MPSNFDVGRFRHKLMVEQLIVDFRVKHFTERKRPPADVFVSYSTRDQQQARSICTKLTENGIGYFVDEKHIEPGADLYKEIEQAIRRRKNYLLLLSEHSASSKWVEYEWAAAGGAGCDRRMLRLARDVSIPPILAHVRADDEPEKLLEYYRSQQYDPESIQVFIRDLLSPISPDELRNFRPVPHKISMWEHQDVEKWSEDRKRFPDVGWYHKPRINRIEIQRDDNLWKLHLHCWHNGGIDHEIELKDNKLTLHAWWYSPERANTEEVHPAFWCQAIEELVRILEGKSILKGSGQELEKRPLVSWWDLYPRGA